MTDSFLRPGVTLLDTDGAPVAAHGAGMLFHDGVYYLYGETRESFHTFPGISCYSSRDLLSWKNEGRCLLPVRDDTSHDLYYTNIIERPKVIYDKTHKRFVMWMHVEDNAYQKACAGVAVCDSPTGPFRYIRSVRPNGYEARDCSLFLDDDGLAYFIHSSEQNSTQHINLLTDDYLDFEGSFIRAWVHEWREAPAIFKHDGRYFSLTSLCTGFSPNEARYAVADSMLGEWTIKGNPCVGRGAESCFRSQVTFVQPVHGKPGNFLFMADRWTPSELAASPMVWLPLRADGDTLKLEWHDQWNWEKQLPGAYHENAQGPRLNVPMVKSVDDLKLSESPTAWVKRRIPDQDYSALAWLGWKPGALVAAVLLVEESGSSLDGAGVDAGDLLDLWFDFQQVSLCRQGHAWKVVPCGGGYGDLSGIALTRRFREKNLRATMRNDVSSSQIKLLGLPPSTTGFLYTVEIPQSSLPHRSVAAGEEFAFSLVVNNRDRSGKGTRNRGYSPVGWRWADTDTYHRLVLEA